VQHFPATFKHETAAIGGGILLHVNVHDGVVKFSVVTGGGPEPAMPLTVTQNIISHTPFHAFIQREKEKDEMRNRRAEW